MDFFRKDALPQIRPANAVHPQDTLQIEKMSSNTLQFAK